MTECKPVVSIIMPIFNAENYLDEAIQSVRKQTFSNFELICIDDCSTDQTREIIKKHVKLDKRVTGIFMKKRSGAGEARNLGMENAVGDYLYFFDGDDYLMPTMIEKVYGRCYEQQLDIGFFPAGRIDSYGNYLGEIYDPMSRKKGVFGSNDINSMYIATALTNVWSKLYRTKYIKDRKISFQNISSCNDVYFSILSLISADRMEFIRADQPLILWRQHETETRITLNRDPFCEYYAWEKIIKDIYNQKLSQTICEGLYLHLFISFISQLKSGEGTREYYTFLSKKGINIIKKAAGDKFNYCKNKYADSLGMFQKNDYDSLWYSNESITSVFFRNDSNRMWRLFRDNKRVIIWGMGDYGKGLIKVIHEKKHSIHRVIDSDKKKIGRVICGERVYSAQDFTPSDTDTIIVAIRKKFRMDCLSTHQVQMINVMELLFDELNT